MKEADKNNESVVTLSVKEMTDKFMGVRGVLFRHIMFKFYLNRDDADDLLQDVYYKMLNNIHKFKSDTNFKAWAYTITSRLFIDKYRVSKKNQCVDVEDDTLELMLKSDRNGSDSLFLIQDIKKAIAAIKNPRDKRLAEMYYDGFKYEEMVDELKVPMGTIKGRLHNVKAYLAKELAMYNV